MELTSTSYLHRGLTRNHDRKWVYGYPVVRNAICQDGNFFDHYKELYIVNLPNTPGQELHYESGSSTADEINPYVSYNIFDGATAIAVIPESVSPCTYFEDVDGVNLYPGDIVKEVKDDGELDSEILIFLSGGKVYDDGAFDMICTGTSSPYSTWIREKRKVKLIGNIYENKDLAGEAYRKV